MDRNKIHDAVALLSNHCSTEDLTIITALPGPLVPRRTATAAASSARRSEKKKKKSEDEPETMDTTAEAAEPAAKRSRCANPNVEGNAARKQSFSQQDENVSGAIAVVSERATTETTKVNKLKRPLAEKNHQISRLFAHASSRAEEGRGKHAQVQ